MNEIVLTFFVGAAFAVPFICLLILIKKNSSILLKAQGEFSTAVVNASAENTKTLIKAIGDTNIVVLNGFFEQNRIINQLTESNEKLKEKLDDLRFDVRILLAGSFQSPQTLQIPYKKPENKRGPGRPAKEKSPST